MVYSKSVLYLLPSYTISLAIDTFPRRQLRIICENVQSQVHVHILRRTARINDLAEQRANSAKPVLMVFLPVPLINSLYHIIITPIFIIECSSQFAPSFIFVLFDLRTIDFEWRQGTTLLWSCLKAVWFCGREIHNKTIFIFDTLAGLYCVDIIIYNRLFTGLRVLQLITETGLQGRDMIFSGICTWTTLFTVLIEINWNPRH